MNRHEQIEVPPPQELPDFGMEHGSLRAAIMLAMISEQCPTRESIRKAIDEPPLSVEFELDELAIEGHLKIIPRGNRADTYRLGKRHRERRIRKGEE